MGPHTSTGSPARSQGEAVLPKEQKARQAGTCGGARVLFASEQTWQRGPSSVLCSVLGWVILGKEGCLEGKP